MLRIPDHADEGNEYSDSYGGDNRGAGYPQPIEVALALRCGDREAPLLIEVPEEILTRVTLRY